MKPTNPPRIHPAPEALEQRIAPASLTFIDVDGDAVTITTSKGTNAALAAAAKLVEVGPGFFQLEELDFSNNRAFHKTNLTIEAAGAGAVDVGYINATGIDLKVVTVDGDLGQLDAGDKKIKNGSVRSLTVESMGQRGVATQGAGGSLDSTFLGKLGSLIINSNLQHASIVVLGQQTDPDPLVSTRQDARGQIGSIEIGGSVIGGATISSGSIFAKGNIGPVTIGGDIVGGAAAESGGIVSERQLGGVTIGGSVIGGEAAAALRSGRLFSGGAMGEVTVAGSVIGGAGADSAQIASATSLSAVTIAGSLEGGTGDSSGAVGSAGEIGRVTITGNIVGGAGEKSGSLLSTEAMRAVTITGNIIGGEGSQSGIIASDRTIASLTVNGSIIGGEGFQSGAVGSNKPLGAVVIANNVIGGAGGNSGQVVSATTIQSVQIGGVLQGGDGFQSGSIGCIDALGPVTISGSIIGGAGTRSGLVIAGKQVSSVTAGSIEGSVGPQSGSIISGGDITSVVLTGDISGGSGQFSGSITADNVVNRVTIDGSIIGGVGENSGVILSRVAINNVQITGDLVGGDGGFSGNITNGQNFSVEGGVFEPPVPGKLGVIDIGGRITGGAGFSSGQVFGSGSLEALQLGGDLVGGVGDFSGRVRAGDIKSVDIVGSILGSAGYGSGALIADQSDLGAVTIGGGLVAGTGTVSGHIGAQRNIDSIDVGSLLGNRVQPALITAQGTIAPSSDAQALALKTLTIRVSTSYANILAGYDIDGFAANPDVQIGDVVVGQPGGASENGGFWQATNLVAGATSGGIESDGAFGTFDDELIQSSTEVQSILSRIARVIIHGSVLSSQSGEGESFGIVAEHVVSVSVGGTPVELDPGPRNDFVPLTSFFLDGTMISELVEERPQ